MTNTYDYDRQAWVKDGLYVRCGHPEAMNCGCYGRLHAGEPAPARTAPLKVVLERKGKRAIALFRADDFAQSLRGDQVRWGSGAMWTVVAVE